LVSDSAPPDLAPRVFAEALRDLGLEKAAGPPPYVLEIGFGRGELLLEMAARNARTYLGVEISRKRVEKMERRIVRAGLPNVKVVHAPAEYLLERALPEGAIAECWIHCPDPWPKKRHHRRRLLKTPLLVLLARVLAPSARLGISTDHLGYAEWIHTALEPVLALENLDTPLPWSFEPPPRPTTAFERDWITDGRRIAYFSYRRRRGVPADALASGAAPAATAETAAEPPQP
jgi:tRNA (guanine-N7-)-methyltransferase